MAEINKPNKCRLLTDKEIQDLIDEADCNAEANFVKSDGSLGILGWARQLINTVAETAPIAFSEQELIEKIAQLIEGRCSETEEFYTGNSWVLRYKLTSEELAANIFTLVKETLPITRRSGFDFR